MLLRRRAPGIDHRPTTPKTGFEHLDQGWIAGLRWLGANRVDYVLVGPAAEAIRGRAGARGALAIVPAPYGRNYVRLERALESAHARQRLAHARAGEADTVPLKVTAEKLGRGQRWALRCGEHDLDIEGYGGGVEPGTRYQELLYEASRFEVADGVAVEVASPEDVEHYAQRARTGTSPEVRISRAPVAAPQGG